jgi:hypothetical protein
VERLRRADRARVAMGKRRGERAARFGQVDPGIVVRSFRPAGWKGQDRGSARLLGMKAARPPISGAGSEGADRDAPMLQKPSKE